MSVHQKRRLPISSSLVARILCLDYGTISLKEVPQALVDRYGDDAPSVGIVRKKLRDGCDGTVRTIRVNGHVEYFLTEEAKALTLDDLRMLQKVVAGP